jgi:cell pole-organizing protein PopZ
MSQAKPQPQAEPSMEEILASIRRIISEDDRPGAKKAAPAPPPEAEEEVLELTDEVEEVAEPEPPPDSAPEPEPEAEEPDVVIELKDRVEPEGEPTDESEPLSDETAAELQEQLLSRRADAESTASFAQLAAVMARQRNAMPLGVGSRTLEDLVKEVMRPMIKDWLDANLPRLVERLVLREIRRVADRGQDSQDAA